jgi:hypothetical protein
MKINNVPEHISSLANLIVSKKNRKAGVYIWGFLYNKNKDKILNFENVSDPKFNSNIHQFIPFYVGQSRDIYKRLGNHSLVRSNDSIKWPRFSLLFMLEFYNWVPLQKHTARYYSDYKDIHDCNNNALLFYSEMNLMKSIYPHNHADIDFYYNRGQAGIADVQGRLNVIDTLSEIINIQNNFWYMEVDDVIASASDRKDCEALIHLSLKGGVISRYHNPTPNVVIQVSNAVKSLGIFELNHNNELVGCNCHNKLNITVNPPRLRMGY